MAVRSGRAVAAAGLLAALAGWRAAARNWGATGAEVRGRYPGDELLDGRVATSTYAVGINAAAEQVWPWLVQLGYGRGGMYSYERLENLLGLDLHNATRVHPEWQRLEVGERVWVVPPGRLGLPDGYAFRVAIAEPGRALVLRQQPPEHPWDATWAFVLVACGPARCRLLARSRSVQAPGLCGALARLAGEAMTPVILLMTRRMLLTLKARAEQQAGERARVGRPLGGAGAVDCDADGARPS